MQPFRIVTYNIAHGRGLSPYQGLQRPATIRRNLLKIARLLESLEPDVVAIQEVDEDSHWNGRINHLEYIRKHAQFPHSVMGVTNRRGGPKPLLYGNGILSKHPIATWENVPFGANEIGGKGFLFVEIDVGGHHFIPFVNLHLDFAWRRNRLAQVEKVADFLTRRYHQRGEAWLVPPILCGDLNNPSTKTDATASLLDYFSRHGNYTLHPMGGRTFPSPFPSRTLDFVFVPPACVQPRSEVVRSLLSDHRPVMVEFTLPKLRSH